MVRKRKAPSPDSNFDLPEQIDKFLENEDLQVLNSVARYLYDNKDSGKIESDVKIHHATGLLSIYEVTVFFNFVIQQKHLRAHYDANFIYNKFAI